MGVIPNPKMTFIFPISCILALIFPILIKYFPNCEGKVSFLKSQIKSLNTDKATIICQSNSPKTTKNDQKIVSNQKFNFRLNFALKWRPFWTPFSIIQTSESNQSFILIVCIIMPLNIHIKSKLRSFKSGFFFWSNRSYEAKWQPSWTPSLNSNHLNQNHALIYSFV